ncbi:hypothetical protein GCM10027168_21140 [Streptomyces capparidis]
MGGSGGRSDSPAPRTVHGSRRVPLGALRPADLRTLIAQRVALPHIQGTAPADPSDARLPGRAQRLPHRLRLPRGQGEQDQPVGGGRARAGRAPGAWGAGGPVVGDGGRRAAGGASRSSPVVSAASAAEASMDSARS